MPNVRTSLAPWRIVDASEVGVPGGAEGCCAECPHDLVCFDMYRVCIDDRRLPVDLRRLSGNLDRYNVEQMKRGIYIKRGSTARYVPGDRVYFGFNAMRREGCVRDSQEHRNVLSTLLRWDINLSIGNLDIVMAIAEGDLPRFANLRSLAELVDVIESRGTATKASPELFGHIDLEWFRNGR